jgi:hypothetical protein
MERQPRPFPWHNSAEESLDRLAGYCRSLNKQRALQPDRTLEAGMSYTTTALADLSKGVCELGQRMRRLLSCQVAAVQIMASWVAGRVS